MLHNIPLGMMATLRAATSVFTASGKSNADQKTLTLSGASIGTASEDRIVIVCFTYSGTGQTATCTVGGVSATAIVNQQGPGDTNYIFALAVPSGTTADVSASVSTTSSLGLMVYALYGAPSTTPYDTLTSVADPMTGTIDIPDNGTVIAVATSYNPASYVWTGVDEDVFLGQLSSGQDSSGSASRDYVAGGTGVTITCDPNVAVSERAMAVVSFGP